MGKPFFLWDVSVSLLYQGTAASHLLATPVDQNDSGTGLVSSGHWFI